MISLDNNFVLYIHNSLNEKIIVTEAVLKSVHIPLIVNLYLTNWLSAC